MKISVFNLFNFIALQVGWAVTCYASASAYPYIGPVFTAIWLCIHLFVVKDRLIDARIVLSAAIVGYLADSLLVLTGVLSFPVSAQLGMPTTLWMVTLWINLALTLRYCMQWLQDRYLLAAIAGALFGPLAYYAGARFGAIQISDGHFALMAIALEWLIAMPLLLWITRASESWEREAYRT